MILEHGFPVAGLDDDPIILPFVVLRLKMLMPTVATAPRVTSTTPLSPLEPVGWARTRRYQALLRRRATLLSAARPSAPQRARTDTSGTAVTRANPDVGC